MLLSILFPHRIHLRLPASPGEPAVRAQVQARGPANERKNEPLTPRSPRVLLLPTVLPRQWRRHVGSVVHSWTETEIWKLRVYYVACFGHFGGFLCRSVENPLNSSSANSIIRLFGLALLGVRHSETSGHFGVMEWDRTPPG